MNDETVRRVHWSFWLIGVVALVWNVGGVINFFVQMNPEMLDAFRESERAWNRGASQQDTKELKEAYVDIEVLDSRLWMRFGLQNIVWGKTELFRTTDQFNPTDLALASLPSLEEARIALWSARFVYSLYDVGAFEDARKLFIDDKASRQRVVIMGGSAMAVWLCRSLRDRNFAVRLFETDRKRAEELAEKLGWVTVIHADPTERSVFDEERIERGTEARSDARRGVDRRLRRS